MAFYIKITKISETTSTARYNFEADKKSGLLEIDKTSGEVSLIEPIEGDSNNDFFNRAGVKIIREWREGRYPDFTEWAS